MSRFSNPFYDTEVNYIWQPYQTFLDPHNQQPGDSVVDYSYFEQYKNQLVVINFASEHWNNFEHWVSEWLDRAGINFLTLTHDPANHQEHPRMFYYPHWYYVSKAYWEECYPDNIAVNKNRNYSVGCLNGGARPHRIANFLKLKKQPYWDKMCVSFHNDADSRSDDFKLFDDEIIEWEQIKPSLPKKNTIKSMGKRADVNSAQLVNSYLHLVTETTVLPTIFISEKTWKPIATAVPFVVWGNPGTMAFLKRLGVDTYDNIIDHKYYDSEEDARSRLVKLHEVINDLVSQGVDKIYNQLSTRLIDNQTKFFQGAFDLGYHNAVLTAIKKYS
jgi:hypothetical protein